MNPTADQDTITPVETNSEDTNHTLTTLLWT